MNSFKYDNQSSLSKKEQIVHPEWVGLKHKLSQIIEETQGTIEGTVFV
jgi:hypothetical protein